MEWWEADVGIIFPHQLEPESFVLTEAEASAPGPGLGLGEGGLGLAQSELSAPSGGHYIHRTFRKAAGHPVQMDFV